MQNNETACLAEHWTSLSQNRKSGPQSALFWDRRAEGFSRRIKGDRKEKRTDEVLGIIKSTGLDFDGAEVLDIGCGPGTFAIPLARMGAKVTALDISEQMLKHLQERTAEENISSIRTLQSSWDEIDIDAQGFRGGFDLVMASMTPGINSPESFEKMMQASRRVCYYSNFVSRKWDASYYDLYQSLFGEKFADGGHGFHIPFMYLYSLGYRPAMKLSKRGWESDETVQSMVDTVSGFFSGRKDVNDEMKARMKKYFEERATDGMYHSTSESITGIMVWEKNGR
ncbi:MAG TPA: class I SAM-dependent methyltransferase [Methanothrix sp.]|nr:class I SAM-dependent methyltransferase [Methanothrix sp.]